MGLLRADLCKIARLGLLWWVLAAMAGVTLLRGLVFPPNPDLPWTGLWGAGLAATGLVVLGALTVGQEFSEGTLRAAAARGVARWRLIAGPWLALVLIAAVLLLPAEGLALLLGVRSELRPAELLRGWLALWPLVSLVVLLAVLARNAGLPLILALLSLAVEQFGGILLGGMAALNHVEGWWQPLTPAGLIGNLFTWTLAYNGANWTYLADPQRIPMPFNILALLNPRDAGGAGLVLAGYTVLGLGLAILLVSRRELSEVVVGRARRPRRLEPGRDRVASAGPGRAARLPAGTGRGPVVLRLARAYLQVMLRTSLLKIGAGVALLFPLALWLVSRLLNDPAFLFIPDAEGRVPLALTACLLMVGLLSTVIAILTLSNELACGTRRAQLARGVTRAQAVAGQSLALLGSVGLLLTWLLAAMLAMAALIAGVFPLAAALRLLGIGLLVAGVYAGAVHVGAALARSTLGPMLAGLGLLAADWLFVIAPTLGREPGAAGTISRYSLISAAFSLAAGRPVIDAPGAAAPLTAPAALGLLLGGALFAHALALAILYRRDA